MTTNDGPTSPFGYPPEVSVDLFTTTSVVMTQTLGTILSTSLFAVVIVRWIRCRTLFNLAMVAPVFPLFVGDMAYYLMILGVMSANAHEPFRTTMPLTSAWQTCGLACIRFRVFSRAGLANWYSPRVFKTVTGGIYLHGTITMAILIWTYMDQLHLPAFRTHPARKLTLIIMFGVAMTVDIFMALCTFKIVWGMRKAVIKRKVASSPTKRKRRPRKKRTSSAGSKTGAGTAASSLDGANQIATLTLPNLSIFQVTEVSSTANEGEAVITDGKSLDPGQSCTRDGCHRTVAAAVQSCPTSPVADRLGSSSSDHGPAQAKSHSHNDLSAQLEASRSTKSLFLPVSVGSNLDHRTTSDISILSPLAATIRGSTARLSVSVRNLASLATRRSTCMSAQELQKIGFERKSVAVLFTISAMLVFSLVGIVVYVFSKDMLGDSVSLVFLKLYTTATIIQWVLLVDLVH